MPRRLLTRAAAGAALATVALTGLAATSASASEVPVAEDAVVVLTEAAEPVAAVQAPAPVMFQAAYTRW